MGRPYMLIGDIFAARLHDLVVIPGTKIGDLAAIDKYAYAKSIDAEVAEKPVPELQVITAQCQIQKPALWGHQRRCNCQTQAVGFQKRRVRYK